MQPEPPSQATPANTAQGEAVAYVRPTRFSILWIIPVVAILISGWLAWRHFTTQGPLVTIDFDTADGIVPGQTQVKNKAVTLGIVKDVTLSPDMSHVIVAVQMNEASAPYMTNHARFWVVRATINGASITGLSTLLSGAYIAFDPGVPDGVYTTHFKGLENPPGIRSDQPGATYWLVTPNLDSLGPGAPVFYRDLPVGEVLGYTLPPGGVGPVLLQIFVKAPYDRYLRTDSKFWNVSGLSVNFSPTGLRVRLQSLQALFSGGVAFGQPPQLVGDHMPPALPDTVFRLYGNEVEADNTYYHERLHVATYLNSSVAGLGRGSKVVMFGVQVGIVTGVRLELANPHHPPRVRVDMVLEPGRIAGTAPNQTQRQGYQALSGFVSDGMRASVGSSSFLMGAAEIDLLYTPNTKPAALTWEGNIAILPSEAGGLSGAMQSLSVIANKIAAMPLTQVGDHLNDLLVHSDQRVRSPQLTQAMVALRESLQSLNSLLTHTDQNLPALMNNLKGTLYNARLLLASYGGNTDFHRDLQALVVQLTQLARSAHFATQYLDYHPSALLTGRQH
ncbi:MCE family protein [Formicincola oecophyllae]|uniref:MCE family protein n=1 Tax=Formicincola oecophyllae TaxID=2558361 RepID=A0A4Y6UA29_9PROT|nr:MlaD family protein [Formicincola oecophyllae]QDH14349.1 MCE family protein [Formicincola oecophyllae]